MTDIIWPNLICPKCGNQDGFEFEAVYRVRVVAGEITSNEGIESLPSDSKVKCLKCRERGRWCNWMRDAYYDRDAHLKRIDGQCRVQPDCAPSKCEECGVLHRDGENTLCPKTRKIVDAYDPKDLPHPVDDDLVDECARDERKPCSDAYTIAFNEDHKSDSHPSKKPCAVDLEKVAKTATSDGVEWAALSYVFVIKDKS